MRSLRLTLLLAIAVAAAAASNAVAAPGSNPPVAQAAGGDVTALVYPALVNTRLVRAQKLLDSAAQYQDLGDDANAVKALAGVRTNLTKAWTGEKFLIVNAPPPVAAQAGIAVKPQVKPQVKTQVKIKAKAKAKASGGAIGGVSPYADYFATASAVLALDHTVATTALSLLDTATPTVLTALNTTLFAALNARDTAIAYIHTIPPPPAAAAGIMVPAHASGTVVVADWSTTMQAILFDTDDELMQLDGLRDAAIISATRTRLLDLAEAQISKAARKVNLYWPPLPAAA